MKWISGSIFVLSVMLATIFPVKQDTEVTFYKNIAPVLLAKCAPCHHDGTHAPFALITYDQARRRAETIRWVVLNRSMPPYKATSDFGIMHPGETMTDDEAVLVQRWVQTGMKEGDPKDIPPQPVFENGWQLGRPDLIVEPEAKIAVKAEGPIYWRTFVISPGLGKKRGLIGFDIRPKSPRNVRQAVLALDIEGKGRREDSKSATPGFETTGSLEAVTDEYIGAWASSHRSWRTPAGVAKTITSKDRLLIQIQYAPDGNPSDGSFELALYFAKGAKYAELEHLELGTRELVIPVLKSPTHERTLTLDYDVRVISVIPEARLAATQVNLTAVLPSGSKKTILRAYPWVLAWVGAYTFENPPRLSKGTKLVAAIAYENDRHGERQGKTPIKYGPALTDELFWVRLQVAPAK
ncbi:MAG: hypothetical protein ACR2HJ_10830 [Fimbriimonadales bacterium]